MRFLQQNNDLSKKHPIFAIKIQYMSTNIVETIRTRLELMGMSQAQFAECVSATPAQMSIFLREKGSLSIESLNKSLDLVGVNLSLYSKRNELAKEVASYLIDKNVSSIDNWTKEDLISITQKKEISVFFDVQKVEEFIEIEKSGIIDVESTFQYFKALVSYYMSLDGVKPTASKAKQALASILKESNATKGESIKKVAKIVGTTALVAATSPVIPVIGISALGMGVAAGYTLSKQTGAFSLFTKSDKPSLFTKAISSFSKKE